MAIWMQGGGLFNLTSDQVDMGGEFNCEDVQILDQLFPVFI